MNSSHQSHVMTVQWGRERLEQQSRGGVDDDHQMGDRKSTTGLRFLGLAEMGLELRGVRHREARTVHKDQSVATPQVERPFA